jgi:hypothetical protein
MPNWCDNNITITGPNSVIDKIEKITDEKSEDGLLQFMYPMPKELSDTTADGSKDKAMMKKHGYSNWYDWAVENWSTKWDVNEFYGVDRQHLNDSLDESTITFGFSSAWAPPIGAYENYINENSNVSIRASYYEPGCDFMGIWDNGIDDCYEVSTIAPKGSVDNFWTSAEGKELDEMFNITEGMAQYEADQEEERIGDNKKIIEYSKGEKQNVYDPNGLPKNFTDKYHA